ncbi:MAG: PrsW family intramembrane metalloprotease [Dehalococcoidales bacterium]|nr:PrsW family intramembrane metalloprotease [Dehalococcoidales bacterium]
MDIVIAFIASLVPSIIVYIWLKRTRKDQPGYSACCRQALFGGFLSIIGITLSALILNIIGALISPLHDNAIPWTIYKTFVLFALTEEFWKYFFFRRTLKKTSYDYSWYDVAAMMTIVGLGFGILESVLYSLSMSPIEAIIRGITLGHGTYGFIMGYYFGKAYYTGKKRYHVIALLVPYLLHALYDFSLSEAVTNNDIFIFTAFFIAVFDVAIVIRMIIFFAKGKKQEKYLESLNLYPPSSAADPQQELFDR